MYVKKVTDTYAGPVDIRLSGSDLFAMYITLNMAQKALSGSEQAEDRLVAQFTEGTIHVLDAIFTLDELNKYRKELFASVAGMYRHGLISEPPALVIPYDKPRDENTPDQINGQPLLYKEDPSDGIGTL